LWGREMPIRALARNARNQHEYWLESRFEGQKSANLMDCFFKNEARRLLKTKAKTKSVKKTKLRSKETGRMSWGQYVVVSALASLLVFVVRRQNSQAGTTRRGREETTPADAESISGLHFASLSEFPRGRSLRAWLRGGGASLRSWRVRAQKAVLRGLTLMGHLSMSSSGGFCASPAPQSIEPTRR
jgi:hypothetical protein